MPPSSRGRRGTVVRVLTVVAVIQPAFLTPQILGYTPSSSHGFPPRINAKHASIAFPSSSHYLHADPSSPFPFVVAKIAVDKHNNVDARAKPSERFTSEESLGRVHMLRRLAGAVMVGATTVNRDDPSLTVRRIPQWLYDLSVGGQQGPFAGGRILPEWQPLRIVVDSSLNINPMAKVLSDPFRTLVISHLGPEEKAEEKIRRWGAMLSAARSRGRGSSSGGAPSAPPEPLRVPSHDPVLTHTPSVASPTPPPPPTTSGYAEELTDLDETLRHFASARGGVDCLAYGKRYSFELGEIDSLSLLPLKTLLLIPHSKESFWAGQMRGRRASMFAGLRRMGVEGILVESGPNMMDSLVGGLRLHAEEGPGYDIVPPHPLVSRVLFIRANNADLTNASPIRFRMTEKTFIQECALHMIGQANWGGDTASLFSSERKKKLKDDWFYAGEIKNVGERRA